MTTLFTPSCSVPGIPGGGEYSGQGYSDGPILDVGRTLVTDQSTSNFSAEGAALSFTA
jgi:hypothetical protein